MDYFDYTQDSATDFDIEEFLKRSEKNQRQILEHELEKIREQLEDRQRIHEQILEELDSKRNWYINRLEKLYKHSFGKKEEKERLKEKIEEFYQEIRREKQRGWRDRQELEKERREILREVDELDTDLFKDLI